MNNLEAFKLMLDDSNIQDDKISALLELYDINPNDEFVRSKDNPINCSFYKLLIERKIAINNINSMSEGGYSVSYGNNKERINEQISSLAYESGCSSLISKYGSYGATIRDISGMLER